MKINISNQLTIKRMLLFFVIFIYVFSFSIGTVSAADLSQEQRDLYDSSILYYDKGFNQCPDTQTSANTVDVNPNLYLIGDSYARGLVDIAKLGNKLTEKGYTPTVNAHSGRSINGIGNDREDGGPRVSALTAIEQDKTPISLAGTIVIVLGTNPDTYDKSIPIIMDKIKETNGSARIFWVNTAHNDPSNVKYIKPTNTAIAKYSKTYNYTVIDWYSLYSKDKTLAGGLHPNTKGYNELAKLILNTIGVPAGSTELDGYKLPAYSGTTGKERIIDPDGIMRGQGAGDEPIAFIDDFKKLSDSDKKAFGNYYITMRWRYAAWNWAGSSKTVDSTQLSYFSKNMPRVVITNPKNNKSIITAAVESGPGPSVGTTWRKNHNNQPTPAPPWWQDYKTDPPVEYDGVVSGITKTTMDALGITEADLGYDANPKAIKLQYSWAPNQSATPGTLLTGSVAPPGVATSSTSNTGSVATGNIDLKVLTDVSEKNKKNVPIIWAWLIGKGFTPEQTAGIMGNIYQESKFDPALQQAGSGEGWGLIQWSFGRRDSFEEYARNRKKPYDDMTTQLNYIWVELTGTYKNRVLIPIQQSKTIEEAMNIFLKDYESPGNYGVESPRRLKYANEVMKAMGGSTISVGNLVDNTCSNSDEDSSAIPTNGEFVHYSQNVEPWGSKTIPGSSKMIKTSGCGLTSYSMIAATLMQDKSITPLTFRDKMVEGNYSYDGYRGLLSAQAGKQIYGLNYKKLDGTKNSIRQALKSGQYVISGGAYGPYRFKSHIVALVSIDSKDKVTVHDPEDDQPKSRYYNLDEFMGSGAYFVAVYK